MFSSRGLFKDIPCPGEQNCDLPNCLFSHDLRQSHETSSASGQVYDPEAAVTTVSPPPAKRQRLHDSVSPEDEHFANRHINVNSRPDVLPSRTITSRTESISANVSAKRKLDNLLVNSTAEPATKRLADSPVQHVPKPTNTPDRKLVAQPVSATRSVSPPAILRMSKTAQTETPVMPKPRIAEIEDEPLQPRALQHSSIPYPERAKKLLKIHEWLLAKQAKLRTDHRIPVAVLMNVKELKKVARDEEQRLAAAAKDKTNYSNSLAAQYRLYNTMPPELFKSYVQTLRSTGIFEQLKDVPKEPERQNDSALNSVEKQRFVLKYLRTGLQQYAKFGYVVKAPAESEVRNAIATEKMNNGQEECDRCGTRFQIFRGRNDEGKLASKGPCRYHWGRLRGGNYTCCNSAGMAGCTMAQNHVFKVSNAARLAALLQFKETPKPNPDEKDRKTPVPVVFDCEMGYTTCGLELIRVTALEWPNKKVLLDVLVRTIGEVIDLNTRFSGVSEQTYSTAPNFPEISHKLYPAAGEPLQKVASPAAARDYMFDLLDPDTPLIGHAIENDLNSCRIIHPFVIDTVLLYPHKRPLPMRKALRDLAAEHLGRTIQASGADGHDSKEDSEATGDLVLLKVKEKWMQMESDNWHFVTKDGELNMVKGRPHPVSDSNSIKL